MKTPIAVLTLSLSFLALLPSNSEAQVAVDLGTAGNFTILSQTGITATGTAGTMVVGDMGVSPIVSTSITGFGSLPVDPTSQFSTSPLVTGKIYAPDYAGAGGATPAMLGVAIGDMSKAYTDAAGRSGPDFLNLGGGHLTGATPALAAGLYKWASGVRITDSITFDGGGDSSAVWIMQVDNRLSLDSGANITLMDGAQAHNIFWQTAEGATLGTNSHFEGILLSATNIVVQTGASMNANLYAKTAVTLDGNAITAIPEPGTYAAIFGGLALVGAAFYRRRLTAKK